MKSGKKQRNGNSITIGIDPTNRWGICHQLNTNPYPDPIKLKNEYLFKLLNAVEKREPYSAKVKYYSDGKLRFLLF